MGRGKQGVLVAGNQNPVIHLQTKYKEVETRFNTWLAKQPLPVEAAVVTVTNAVQGAAVCGFVGILCPATYQAVAAGPLVHARDSAAVWGVGAGISCVMKRLRGKEDVETAMAACFGSGVMYSLVKGMGGHNQAADVILSGVGYALLGGGLFKVGEKGSQSRAENLLYKETRGMLTSLGLEKFEKNFKRGFLTDNALPLLTDSDLLEAKIPPGARRLILDHIEREKEVKKSG